jgi:hypothetical protein
MRQQLSFPLEPYLLPHMVTEGQRTTQRGGVMGGEDAPEERSRHPGELLPQTPGALNVLLALADGERHGYEIMLEVRERRSCSTPRSRRGALCWPETRTDPSSASHSRQRSYCSYPCWRHRPGACSISLSLVPSSSALVSRMCWQRGRRTISRTDSPSALRSRRHSSSSG